MTDATPQICAHPGCDAELSAENRIGVCSAHIHRAGCTCRQCLGTQPGVRIRSRAELTAMGLLPYRIAEVS